MFWKRKSSSNVQELAPKLQPATARHDQIYREIEHATMTSPQRVWALCEAIDRISEHDVLGDIVECGVWRGGSMMAAAKSLLHQRETSRTLWLFDTFGGMTEPEACDVDHDGMLASQLMETTAKQEDSVWCIAALQQVKNNLRSTGYPSDKMRFVAGPVETTLLDNRNLPDRIALLRLDTDWYRSTLLELAILYPRLVPGGVLIIDDYGHWQGCRKAVDEYFADQHISLELKEIDYTGRIGIKPFEQVALEANDVA